MFLLLFRLISKEPYIDKTRIGVYGKVRRPRAGVTALWDGVSVGVMGPPVISRLAVLIPAQLFSCQCVTRCHQMLPLARSV